MITPRRPVFLNEEQMQYLNPTEDTLSWSIVADETAEILIGRSANQDKSIREGVISLITDGDVEDIATLWSNSPETCLAGMMWRSFLIYQWLIDDEQTLRDRFKEGMDSPVQQTSEVDYEEVTDLLVSVMHGRLEQTGKTIYEFYSDMAAFLRVLAAGVSADPNETVYEAKDHFAELLTIKAGSLLLLASQFEDASTDIDTLNHVNRI